MSLICQLTSEDIKHHFIIIITWLVPREVLAVLAQVLCTPYNHAPCLFMQSYIICKVHACLSVTCHLHVWQNDRNLLRATEVTRGWNGYRNKRRHRKLTLEKKILPPLLPGLEPANFRSRVRRFNQPLSYPGSPKICNDHLWEVVLDFSLSIIT